MMKADVERRRAVKMLIAQVQTMVEESGNPNGFDAARWVREWLQKPLPALGGKRPVEYMSTQEGRELVGRLLAMAQSGAYA
jgi:uncharacterized protein (DUF2384 family)